MSSSSKRIDPAVKKLLYIVYILYFWGLIENILLPTNGMIMVVGLAILLFQSKTIKMSSYIPHFWWLILTTTILLTFTLINIKTPIKWQNLEIILQTKYIGQFIYGIMTFFGLFYLSRNKQSPIQNFQQLPFKK